MSWAGRSEAGAPPALLVVPLAAGAGATRRGARQAAGGEAAEREDAGEEDRAGALSLLDRRFAGVALPALAQLVTEPLAALVDTANIGHLSREALGGMGVAVAAQYSLTKLFNDPLLRVTTSLVAASPQDERREVLDVVLLLALALGLYQAAVFGTAAGAAIRGMGVSPESPMFSHAVAYLRIRALGAPLSSLVLTTTGACRGLGDARSPMLASVLTTLVNVVLDPLLIFGLGWGCAGAAVATVAAQGCGLAVLALRFRALRRRGELGGGGSSGSRRHVLLRSLRSFVVTAGIMIARNWGKVFCFAFLARQAALHGPVVAGAYSLTFQLGFATSQVAESLATSTQVLLAQALRKDQESQAFAPLSTAEAGRHVVVRGLQAGLALSLLLGTATLLFQGSVLRLMTSDALVRATASGAMLWVLLAQALKAMAYPMNGALMGALDWNYSAVALWIAGLAGVASARLCGPGAAAGGTAALAGLWVGLVGFFGVQLLLGLGRIASGRGPWRALRRSGRKGEVA